MDQRPLSRPPPSLHDCIQTVIDVAHAYGLHYQATTLGNLVRVHLGQAVLMAKVLPAMDNFLTAAPLEALVDLPGLGGHRERTVRCVRVARQALVLYSFSPACQRQETTDLVHAGTTAYRLAADSTASYDRWVGDLWWELGESFPHYGQVVAASNRLLDQSR